MSNSSFEVGDVLEWHRELMVVYQVNENTFDAIELRSEMLYFPIIVNGNKVGRQVVTNPAERLRLLRQIANGGFCKELSLTEAARARRFLNDQLLAAKKSVAEVK